MMLSKRQMYTGVSLSFALLLLVATFPSHADEFADGFVKAPENKHPQINTLTPKALMGDAAAQYRLARIYHEGNGVAKDEENAIKWYQRAAQNGSLPAQRFLSTAYSEGLLGLPNDDRMADYWAQKSSRMAINQ